MIDINYSEMRDQNLNMLEDRDQQLIKRIVTLLRDYGCTVEKSTLILDITKGAIDKGAVRQLL